MSVAALTVKVDSKVRGLISETGFNKYGDYTNNTFIFAYLKCDCFLHNFFLNSFNGFIFRHTHLEESSFC